MPESSAPMCAAYDTVPRRAPWGPCARHQTTQPTFERVYVDHPLVPVPPGLVWESSPYVYLPQSNHSAGEAERQNSRSLESRSRSEPTQPRLKPIALPPQITGVTAVTLNPVLRFGAESLRGAHIDVDFALARPDTRRGPTAGVMIELAVFPALPSLTLLSPRLPWAITVHASGASVVVGDVLKAIHRALGIRITKEQLMAYGDDQSASQKRNRGGMTRLDLLAGKTKFAGLSESKMGCEIWVVNFA
ncbi:hypothetical protein DFH06DRAFT_655701 [Mycena polygramma]|nr:hypothetical protein DFH06DRAFT_655701 [Mycena polygramma]